jgi:hypothetical protein
MVFGGHRIDHIGQVRIHATFQHFHAQFVQAVSCLCEVDVEVGGLAVCDFDAVGMVEESADRFQDLAVFAEEVLVASPMPS